MRFGCELYLHPIASFPFPGKRGHLFLWPLFPARPQLFAIRKRARRAIWQFRKEREIDRAARLGPSRDKKRLAQDDKPLGKASSTCLTTNCGAANADGPG